MTTGSRSAPWALSGDAAWRTWCDAIYNSLTDAGWVQTSDTGQRAVPAADSYPVASSTFTNWVFRLNDSQQSTCPVFMKVEVSRGSGTANFMFRITIGTGTNGAGVIANPVINQAVHGTSSWAPTTSSPGITFISCIKNGAAWFNTLDVPGGFIYVGRTVNDSTGSVTTDGWLAVVQLVSGSRTFGIWDNTKKLIIPSGNIPYPPLTSVVAGVRPGTGGVTQVIAPKYRFNDGLRQFAGMYGLHRYDSEAGGVFSLNQFGLGAENYLFMGGVATTAFPNTIDSGGQTSATAILVWG